MEEPPLGGSPDGFPLSGSPTIQMVDSDSSQEGTPTSRTRPAQPAIQPERSNAEAFEYFASLFTNMASPGHMIEASPPEEDITVQPLGSAAADRQRQLFILYLLSLTPQLRNSPRIAQNLVDAQIVSRELLDEAITMDLASTIHCEQFQSFGGVIQNLRPGFMPQPVQSSITGTAMMPYVPTSHPDVSLQRQPSRYFTEFEDFKFLGRGAFGQVYQATHRLDGALYAIKAVPVTARDSLELIRREIHALASLEHPNCVRYYTAWVEDGVIPIHSDLEDDASSSFASGFSTESSQCSSPFYDRSNGSQASIVLYDSTGGSLPLEPWDRTGPPHAVRGTMFIQMQLCTSRTLSGWINDSAARAAADATCTAVCYFKQIVSGLAHVHSRGLIHRDLKPGNIFFSLDGTLKIGDFGLSVVAATDSFEAGVVSRRSQHTTGVGTPSYASPEQLAGAEYSNLTDVFSLGMILFELLHSMETGMERARLFQQVREGSIPERFVMKFPLESGLLARMVALDPGERPATASILQSAMFVLGDPEEAPDREMLVHTIREQDNAMKQLQATVERLLQLTDELRSPKKDGHDGRRPSLD